MRQHNKTWHSYEPNKLRNQNGENLLSHAVIQVHINNEI